jgi:radical SAM superfamily enzyme
LEDYTVILSECIESLRPDIVVHRITGDGKKSQLISPLWSANKKLVLNYINKYFKENNIIQGRRYINGS